MKENKHAFTPFTDADNALVCGHITGPGGTGNPPYICGLPPEVHSGWDAFRSDWFGHWLKEIEERAYQKGWDNALDASAFEDWK